MRKRLLSPIPYRHITISTSLTIDEIVSLFSKSISPTWNPISQAAPPNHKKYQGEVSAHGFHIRMTSYYGPTLTYLTGKFIPDMTGVKVAVYINPGPAYFVFVLVGIVGICFLLGAIVAQNYFTALAVGFVLMVLSAGSYFEVDSLDWFIGNLLEEHII